MLSGGLDISNTAPLHLRAGGGTKHERLLIAVCRSFHPLTLPLSAIGPTTTHWCWYLWLSDELWIPSLLLLFKNGQSQQFSCLMTPHLRTRGHVHETKRKCLMMYLLKLIISYRSISSSKIYFGIGGTRAWNMRNFFLQKSDNVIALSLWLILSFVCFPAKIHFKHWSQMVLHCVELAKGLYM